MTTPRCPITTHVLDLSLGLPAAGLEVTLCAFEGGVFAERARRRTDADGRVGDLLPALAIEPGVYRLRFFVAEYFQAGGRTSFYPYIDVVFELDPSRAHHHVPLLLSPYGYSTYRGS
ncbi:MAG: hydroxyisourate hydrolase [Myxococcales bacterium]|nr:hydroxyisourate hydrolase [Myxococcales bacterium]